MLISLKVDQITANQPTEDNFFNDRDEVYFVITGASSKGEIQIPRISPPPPEDYYGLHKGESAKDISLLQLDLATGEEAFITVVIREQDNAQLGSIVQTVKAAAEAIAAIITGDSTLGDAAAQDSKDAAKSFVESLKKDGDDTIGAFSIRIINQGETFDINWDTVTDTTIALQGGSSNEIQATGSNANYTVHVTAQFVPTPSAPKASSSFSAALNPNHLDVFWVGPDGGIGTNWWDANANNGQWNTPFPITPPNAARPGAIAAVARNPHHLDVFWVAPDGAVMSNWWDANANNGQWNTPFPIAPPNAAQPGAIAAVARNPHHLDVFWVGPDGGIGTNWWDANANNGQWNTPFPIAPPNAARPGAIAAVARNPHHLDVFWVGPDGGIGTNWWDADANSGHWNTPFPITPPNAARPGAIAAVALNPNHLDVFWVGPDGGIGTNWWDANANNGQWNTPFPIALPNAARPGAIAAVALNPNHLDVFWVGPDGGIGTNWWDANANNGQWNTPFPIAPPNAAQPGAIAAVALNPNHLDVFWVGPDGGIGTNWWDANANSGHWNTPFPITPPNAAQP